MRECRHCHKPLDLSRRRIDALYCNDRCKDKAWYRRRVGLPEDHPGGRRGRLRLGQPTKVERERAEAYEQGRVDGARDVVEQARKRIREEPLIGGRRMRRHEVDELG